MCWSPKRQSRVVRDRLRHTGLEEEGVLRFSAWIQRVNRQLLRSPHETEESPLDRRLQQSLLEQGTSPPS